MTTTTSPYKFRKQVVAVLGGTGQVGTPLTKTLLELGHAVRVFSRRDNSKLDFLKEEGATIVVQRDLMDKELLTKNLQGVEVLICAVPASQEIVTISEPLWLECAVAAGVKRFCPSEFGAHTLGMPYGEKDFHKKLFAANIGWTLLFTGGIFDYFLPNLRFFEKITTFGNLIC